MKKIYFLSVLIPLVFIAQEVFSASYKNGFYSAPSPTTARMNLNNAQLKEDTMFYNSELNNEMSKLKNSMLKSFNTNTDNQNTRLYSYQQQYQTQQEYPRQQYQRPSFYKNSNNEAQYQIKEFANNKNSQLKYNKQSQPKWWRQENSFQGWGFD